MARTETFYKTFLQYISESYQKEPRHYQFYQPQILNGMMSRDQYVAKLSPKLENPITNKTLVRLRLGSNCLYLEKLQAVREQIPKQIMLPD